MKMNVEHWWNVTVKDRKYLERKTVPHTFCPAQNLHGSNSGLRSERPTTNHRNHGTLFEGLKCVWIMYENLIPTTQWASSLHSSTNNLGSSGQCINTTSAVICGIFFKRTPLCLSGLRFFVPLHRWYCFSPNCWLLLFCFVSLVSRPYVFVMFCVLFLPLSCLYNWHSCC